MKLLRFRVTNFRSVEDSGWIETDDVTAFIGTNESGKTNILLPLWKLNPAKEGEIVATADYPRKHYNDFRNLDEKPVFIEAVFDVGEELVQELATMTGSSVDEVRETTVSRCYDGTYSVGFPKAAPQRTIKRERLGSVMSKAVEEISAMPPMKTEEALKTEILKITAAAEAQIKTHQDIDDQQLKVVRAFLGKISFDGTPKSSSIAPRFQRLLDEIKALEQEVSQPHPEDFSEARALVKNKLPKFVYYSNYGNLDSEIYLPYVIENIKREDIGAKEGAKARTLKVLFEFVKLKPEEILELGQELKPGPNQAKLTQPQIDQMAEQKKERSILLQSASADLTQKFRDWWKRGDYRFRFEADGNHFRIWVSDDKRPEEIELEGRSTGLQWFLSFYLVFLVERADAHADSILLLDEPGLSLHPHAQEDLSAFFDGLAKTNQLLYTSHSPFLIVADRLDRARKVYVDQNGTSKVTADLGSVEGDSEKRGAGYTVFAALGLSVAESYLVGCTAVIVEGPSDQYYLSAIKNLLIASGKLKPVRELVFPPAGGTKGVKAVVSILGGRDEKLPVVLVDSDAHGKAAAQALRSGLYASEPNLILDVQSFTKMPNSEIEDLLPTALIIAVLDRWQRGANTPFADKYVTGKPIVPQIEAWAQHQGIELAKPGWKVELAKQVKERLLKGGLTPIPENTVKQWEELFKAFDQRRADSA